MTQEAAITLRRSAELPPTIHGAVIGSGGRYTIPLNANDTPARQLLEALESIKEDMHKS